MLKGPPARRGLLLRICAAIAVTALAAGPALGPSPAEAQSGEPNLPRFAALKANEVRFRRGPDTNTPIDWVYRRRFLPVEIFQETETWRRVRDPYGYEGWVHKTLLTGRRRAIVTGQEMQNLYSEARADSKVVARLQPGVIGEVTECNDAFCRFMAHEPDGSDGYTGWVARPAIWGVYDWEKGRL